MKRLLLILLLLFFSAANAQLKSIVTIKFHGINCSYCLYKMQHRITRITEVQHIFFERDTLQIILPEINEQQLMQFQRIIRESGFIPSAPVIEKTD